MTNITAPEAQSWIDKTKLAIDTLDTNLESSISEIVLSMLQDSFNTTTWTTSATTPVLVRKVIALFYCARFYKRQYAEAGLDTTYGDDLEAMAMDLIEGIQAGNITLRDIPASDQSPPSEQADFFPNDAAGVGTASVTYDPYGPRPVDDTGDDVKFRMGAIW